MKTQPLAPWRGEQSSTRSFSAASRLLAVGFVGCVGGVALLGILFQPRFVDAACDGGPDCGSLSTALSGAGRKRKAAAPLASTQGRETRWQHALASYVSTIAHARAVALGADQREIVAHYFAAMHDRIHPIFADKFLPSLERRSSAQAMDLVDTDLAVLEMAIDRDGRIADMGIVKSSGVGAFDIAVLESVHKASPFGTPPTGVLSDDGQFHLRWQFQRDRKFACSTSGATAFKLVGVGGQKDAGVISATGAQVPSTPPASADPPGARTGEVPPGDAGVAIEGEQTEKGPSPGW